jgi:V8-like Glu-specific endopeptidase
MAIRRLTFLGERDAPDSLTDVHSRRALLGTGRRPKQLVDLATNHSVYLEGSGRTKPSVRVAKVAEGGNVWRIDMPIDEQLQGARPGITARRGSPDDVLKKADRSVGYNGLRPAWADTLFVPRRAAGVERPTLRRISGRRVTPLWVYGNDDRWQFRDPAWPWGLVGRIFNSEGYSGTGALVGDRLVITAGHMVPWGGGPWWMRFVPAYYDGASLHGAGVESYVSDAYGYDSGEVAGYDWAILRLYEPLGSMLGYYGYNGYSESWNDRPYWSIIGYPGAVANAQRPSFQGAITVGDVDSDSNGGEELESDTADITAGDSGGPMFAWWGNDPRIVGVVSGEEEYTFLWWTFDQDNIMAAGAGFTSLIAWGRTNWPA